MAPAPITKQSQRRPLESGDSPIQTVGCRHSDPNICKNHSTRGKCAFVRDDGFCIIPPMSWKKIYISILEGENIMDRRFNKSEASDAVEK